MIMCEDTEIRELKKTTEKNKKRNVQKCLETSGIESIFLELIK